MSKFDPTTTTTTTITTNFNEQVFINSLGKLKTNQKKYDCDQCSKYFTRPSALQTHIYSHTGEKPHRCDMPGCGRRFAVISNLRRHLRVHRPSHVRRNRLSSQERREYVEKLIKRSGADIATTIGIAPTTITISGRRTFDNDDSDLKEEEEEEGGECNMYYNTFPSMCYSSSTSSVSSASSLSRGESMSPTMESTTTATYRLLKPKETRPLCLTVKHLLN